MKQFFTCLTSLFSLFLNAQTFSSAFNTWVPDDGSTATYDVVVSGLPDGLNGDFGLVQVCLNMDHTYDSDMNATLRAPDGSTFLLFNGIGGDGDNFSDCCLRDDADDYIYSYSPPFTGTFRPMGNMGVVNNGQNPNGIWSLILFDTYAFADQGYLYDFSITFGNNAPVPFEFLSSNLPIAKIFTDGVPVQDEPKIEGTLQIINNGIGELNYLNDTNYEYEGQILVELQGFTGPWYPKKNYDFDLIDSEGLEIDTSLLGMPAENDWIFKAEYLDPSLMYNSIAYEFSRRMGRYAPRTQYCELFLNGEYQGVYNLTEKVKRSDNRVNIARLDTDDIAGDSLTGGYIIEMNINGDPGDWNSEYQAINYSTNGLPVEFKHVYPKSWEVMPEQHDYIRAYVDSFEYSLHQPDFDDPQNGYRKWIGENSFIDFMLVNEMSTNYDSYGRSTFMYKEKINDGGQLKIGPPWDYDRGFCCVEGWVWELTHPGWPFPDWWSIFHQDDNFVQDEWCRWTGLREELWTTDAFMAYIDSLHLMLGDAAARNFERWPELGYGNFDGNVADLKQRLSDRLDWMDANIIGNGACVPSLVNGAVNNEDFEGGYFPPNCWTLVDADNDGSFWNGNQPVIGNESPHSAFSYSFGSPDNYLITPKLHPAAGEHLTWYCAGMGEEVNEHYQVLLSTTGTAPSDFNVVLWEETYNETYWSYRAADLEAWWGQDIYIAFRHFNSDGQIMLRIDDVRYPTWTNPGENCLVNLDELNNNRWSVYPNPGTGTFTVSWPTGNTLQSLQLQDALGRTVQTNNAQSANNHSVSLHIDVAGLYSLTLCFENGGCST
ncbi:MAG: CotH kinase family protein, partial [Flavobacteriales bacterium]|nr:CotH kinase family protein [Flavobacteriales bacterium]